MTCSKIEIIQNSKINHGFYGVINLGWPSHNYGHFDHKSEELVKYTVLPIMNYKCDSFDHNFSQLKFQEKKRGGIREIFTWPQFPKGTFFIFQFKLMSIPLYIFDFL